MKHLEDFDEEALQSAVKKSEFLLNRVIKPMKEKEEEDETDEEDEDDENEDWLIYLMEFLKDLLYSYSNVMYWIKKEENVCCDMT